MKLPILFFLLLSYLSNARPANIPSKITELKPKEWYAAKAIEWKKYLADHPADQESWTQYFIAAKYARGITKEIEEIKHQIINRFPDSFLAHYVDFQVNGWTDQGIKALEKALKIDDSKMISMEDQLTYGELSGKDRSTYSRQLFEAGMIHSSTLNYGYNLLMSVAEDGLLIMDGLHLTTPLWVLQDVMNIRKDIAILNLELASSQNVYTSKLLMENGFNGTVNDLLKGQSKEDVYYALTLPRELINQNEKNLYVVGLASTERTTPRNHFETLKNNIENRFLLDYLTIDFNGEPQTATGQVLSTNYVVPLLLLKDFYDDLSDGDRSNELTEQIKRLTYGTQMETRVAQLLNKNAATEPFKYVVLNIKEVDKKMKLIKGKLYASEQEVNNCDYWFFMEYLRTNGYTDLYEKFFQDLSSYDPITKSLMSNYHYTPVNFKELDAKSKKKNMLKYPAMDFTYEAALAFCKWMTDQYNGNEKRAFKKVLFRLPSQEEWTMAALGYRGFQSWKLEENTITVKSKEGKAPELQVSLSEHTISYPWGIKAWDFRNRINNKHNCYLANVKIGEKITCAAGIKGDGFSFTSPGTTYFANEMGLYDVVGNVAEMISDPGVAMGGSWDDTPEKSTITSSYRYEGSDIKVGMRLFMEVIEE